MSVPSVLGVDIGGANIKMAHSLGGTVSEPFPLWKHPGELCEALTRLASLLHDWSEVAVTMTGELADCFADRAEGVAHIVSHAVAAFGGVCKFYSVEGTFLPSEAALQATDLVAASNWHAMASLVAKSSIDSGLLIDIGSTTTDLIPFAGGVVSTDSKSDFDRLRRGELIYAGVGRTPICSLVDALPFSGTLIPVMREFFATTDDCALLTGLVEECEHDLNSADGRPRTRYHATGRMARMLGLNHGEVDLAAASEMALYIWERFQAECMIAAQALSAPDATWVLCGHGQALVPIPEDRRCLDLSQAWNAQISRVGPAFAVATLASHTPEQINLLWNPNGA